MPPRRSKLQRVLARVLVAAAVFLVSANAGPPFAQTTETIRDIRVVGTRRIEPSTVMSYMELKPGDAFDVERMDRSLKSLFNTGLFADVTLRREGDSLIVQVVENPIINRIAFEGNDRIDDETLSAEVSLRPRVVFTRTKVQQDVQRIQELYRRSGRFAATVEPKVIQLPENRIDLAFEINEGPATGIRRISFIGNERFSDRTLRGVVQTKESRFYRFFTADDTYDPDRLTFDRELLRRFYLAEGYADFRVVSAVAELTLDREAFIITFTVEEGERYRFGDIDVVADIRDLDPEVLRALVVTEPGRFYNADEVEETLEVITDAAGAQGFAFVDVRPRVRRDREERTIGVTYDVREGPRVFVERIDITGNLRTLDKVIRREFELVEGDAFNTAKVRRSRQRLRNLGYFSRIDVENNPGSAPDKTVVNVDVVEQSTGELSVGAGFSTGPGLLGDLSIRERNLLGRGQDLRLSLTLAQEQQQIDLSFTDPFFLDRNLSAGFDVFRTRTDFTSESSFEEDEVGFGLRAGYQFSPRIRHNLRYTLSRDDISNVQDDASLAIQQQEGSEVSSIIGNEFFFDALDSRIQPTDGVFARYKVDLASPPGTIKFLRNEVEAGYFLPLFGQNVILGLSAEAGYIFGIGDDVRIVDSFFLGGANLRGFKTAGVGPRDLATDDALGGKQVFSGTAELQLPTGLPEELGIDMSVFSDFGTLTDLDVGGPSIEDEASIRASIGVGVGWRSPFGPIRVDLSQAVLKEDFDETEALRLNFGTRF
ncbi:MAG: outer membrane protein assembly factor BamA [Alphaproteobacteria bacterium]